ncbi:hypothetical protein FB446DRAFT_795461 [Lentinula raphanica]|nr:hypothetical protein FB446DRAFT_795461 [Lentinula raphanica]
MSNTSVSTARYMEFERGLRRRVILQILRNTDLQNSSTTLISDQGVIMNISEGTVVACEQPKIMVAFSPIRDEEFEPYRKQYPAPFSEDDRVRGVGPRSPVIPDREPGDEPPPRQGGGSEWSRPPSNNERPPPNAFRVDGGDEGPPEPSDNGRPGNDDRSDRHSRHPSEGSIPRMGVPERFNPRSLAGIGEFYTYEPKTVSEEDCLNEILRVYIDLVNYHLIMKPATGNNNAQKTILQNIPKPEFYYGEEDIMKFDTWVRTLIRWLNVADQCGPESRFSHSRQRWVITAVDIQRVNTLSSFLRGDAREWYDDTAEQVPLTFGSDYDTLTGHHTFTQVLCRLFRHFIHEASLTTVSDRFYGVEYSSAKGIKGLFIIPPPDMSREMTRTVTAETSSVNDIMKAAMKWEKGNGAYTYYAKTRAARTPQAGSSKPMPIHEHGNRSNNGGGNGNQPYRSGYRRQPSPKRLQVVDGRRYQVPVHPAPNREKPTDRRSPKTPDPTPGQRPKPKTMGVCWGCGKAGHYQGDPACKENGKPKPNQLYRMVDQDGSARDVRLFRISANEMMADTAEPVSGEHQNDEDIWERYEQSAHGDEETQSDPEPWGGSQYESDPMDNEYITDEHIGFMQEQPSSYFKYYERFGMMDGNTNHKPEEIELDDSSSIASIHSLDEIESIAASEEVDVLDVPEFIRTMKSTKDNGFVATQKPVRNRAPTSGTRPRRTATENHCLAAFVEINGVQAFALFDSGSTADAISPEFARVAHIAIFKLENPVQLQLGTKGSRSQITYGCVAPY